MKPNVVTKTVADPAEPEVLGSSIIRGTTVTFAGFKAPRTENVGTVWIQVSSTDASPALRLFPGQTLSWPSGIAGSFTANDFYIDVENAGDGVEAFFSL